MRFKFFFIYILLLSCGNEYNYIDPVYVYERVYLDNPENSELKIPGNYKFIEGGIKGIVVYNFGSQEYLAFDRVCTFENNIAIDSINSIIAICKNCDSKFLLNQNGINSDGPAPTPLIQYNCVLRENNTLYITN